MENRTIGRPGSLPVELTTFIGRDQELTALRQLLVSSRLITLTGAGGSGKSRLALELAADLRAHAPDGVVWVELAPLADPQLLPAHVMDAAGLPSEGGATAQTLTEAVGSSRIALVLDNCEHLVDACAALVATLLRSCPGLRVLATSREALAVGGERAWLVPALAVPPADADSDSLAGFDAVRLFVDRAGDVLSGFTLTPANAPAVAAICARLDGIPLAIELAAARMRHMTADQIRDRLDDVFSLLTTGSRTALPRHRTLRAALDWSHDLLTADARTVFRRLAVFRGGFALDAVETVAAGDGIEAGGVLDLIGVLVDRSMVVVREQHGRARYQLLEPLRQYAAQRLQESGEEARVRRLFAGHVTTVVAAAEPAFITTERRAAFQALEPELDNIREALQWTRSHEPAAHVRLVGMLWWFWYSTRHWVEAHQWITDALALPAAAEPTRPRAALLFAAGALASLRGQPAAAQPCLEEAARIAADAGDERLEAYALNYLGMAYAQQSKVEAREYSGRAAQWFRLHGDPYGLRLALLLVGLAERAAGRHDESLRLTREAVDIARTFGQDRELAIALQNLAVLLLDEGDHAAAGPVTLESLRALRRDPSSLFIYRGIEQLALVTAAREPGEAARQLGAADSIRRHIGANRFPFDERRIEELATALRTRLGEAEYGRLYGEGLSLQPADALDAVLDRLAAAPPADHATAARPASAQHARPAPAAPSAMPVPAVDAPKPDLLVRALGPFEVAVRGSAVERWPFAKPKELLIFLLTHPQGRTRADIGSAIWPDATTAQVRNSFHVALHHLRKALGQPDWIVLENERYRVRPDLLVDYDVARFDSAARGALGSASPADGGAVSDDAVAALQDALRLYRDHFFAGEPAGPWRDELQDRLRRLCCDAGVRLGDLLARRGELAAAAAAYEAVTSREPLHEEAHRGLLKVWFASGDRAHAVRHYERLTALLRSELDTEPDVETVELFERIRVGQPAP